MIEISSFFLFILVFWFGDSQRFLRHLTFMLVIESFKIFNFSVVQFDVMFSSHLISCLITVHVVQFQVALIMTITNVWLSLNCYF